MTSRTRDASQPGIGAADAPSIADFADLRALAEKAKNARLAYEAAPGGADNAEEADLDAAIEALDAVAQPYEDTLIALLDALEAQNENRSRGGDGAKRSAPVAWLLTHPTEPTDCELASPWKEPITDADRAAGWSAEPLYRAAAPVLPVEVRSGDVWSNIKARLAAQINLAEDHLNSTVSIRLRDAKTILSTITGDA